MLDLFNEETTFCDTQTEIKELECDLEDKNSLLEDLDIEEDPFKDSSQNSVFNFKTKPSNGWETQSKSFNFFEDVDYNQQTNTDDFTTESNNEIFEMDFENNKNKIIQTEELFKGVLSSGKEDSKSPEISNEKATDTFSTDFRTRNSSFASYSNYLKHNKEKKNIRNDTSNLGLLNNSVNLFEMQREYNKSFDYKSYINDCLKNSGNLYFENV